MYFHIQLIKNILMYFLWYDTYNRVWFGKLYPIDIPLQYNTLKYHCDYMVFRKWLDWTLFKTYWHVQSKRWEALLEYKNARIDSSSPQRLTTIFPTIWIKMFIDFVAYETVSPAAKYKWKGYYMTKIMYLWHVCY